MEMIKLHNGVQMPYLVQATNYIDYQPLKRLVKEGLQIGVRAFDTARDYGNEDIVGKVISECIKDCGLKRDDIFITTKIGNGQQALGDIMNQIDISLNNLRTDYIDLWLMHWPYQNYYIDTWHKMQEVYQTGKVRAIGVANFEIRHVKKILEGGFTPHCIQIEHHPMRTLEPYLDYLKEKNIVVQSYSPLCRMITPIRSSEKLQKLAKKYNKTIAQIILRWHYQLNTVSVFKTTNVNRLRENCDIWDFSISEDDMVKISSLNEDYKYHLESASCPGY